MNVLPNVSEIYRPDSVRKCLEPSALYAGDGRGPTPASVRTDRTSDTLSDTPHGGICQTTLSQQRTPLGRRDP